MGQPLQVTGRVIRLLDCARNVQTSSFVIFPYTRCMHSSSSFCSGSSQWPRGVSWCPRGYTLGWPHFLLTSTDFVSLPGGRWSALFSLEGSLLFCSWCYEFAKCCGSIVS